ncbi:zinc-binding dehydrogenase [Microbacterium sp. MMO-10]|uniref:zinc-binding dehydrogenase n=1 Tax=Microbacterium sp. MMO-10 TaxID=3081272 RepID=UPI00301B02FF
MRSMRAQRLNTVTHTFAVEEVPLPRPGAGEVLVSVAYCGICHSDLSLIDGVLSSPLPVITQGHEASGIVAEIGEGVRGWAPGDRVVLPAGRPCRTCRSCLQEQGDCASPDVMAFQFDGAWAEYAVVHAGGLSRVPEAVPLDQAAILADAVATPYGAVVHTGNVRVGESVAVWGIGGVGTHLVQIARLVGAAPIIALDVDPRVRARALEAGADHALDPRDPSTPARLDELTRGAGVDVAFDSVGITATMTQALASIRNDGRLVLIGLSADPVPLGPSATFAVTRKRVLGHLGYRNSDIPALLRLVETGRLDLSGSISDVVALDDIAAAIDRLRSDDERPVRILVAPGDRGDGATGRRVHSRRDE